MSKKKPENTETEEKYKGTSKTVEKLQSTNKEENEQKAEKLQAGRPAMLKL